MKRSTGIQDHLSRSSFKGQHDADMTVFCLCSGDVSERKSLSVRVNQVYGESVKVHQPLHLVRKILRMQCECPQLKP